MSGICIQTTNLVNYLSSRCASSKNVVGNMNCDKRNTGIFFYLCNDITKYMELDSSDTLYIRISQKEIVFARYDHLRSRTLNYVGYNVHPNISLNANVHDAVGKVALAKGDFNYVRILVEGPATLVPLNDFDEENATDFYFFNIPEKERKCRVFYDILPHLNAVLLFSIDKDVCHTLEETFVNLFFQSSETPQLLHFASCCPASLSQRRIFISLYQERMGMVAFQKGKLILYNSYELHHAKDAVYYALQTIRTCQFSSETDEVFLAGDRQMSEQLQSELSVYLPHVDIIKAEEEFNANVLTLQQALPYDMITLLLRAY